MTDEQRRWPYIRIERVCLYGAIQWDREDLAQRLGSDSPTRCLQCRRRFRPDMKVAAIDGGALICSKRCLDREQQARVDDEMEEEAKLDEFIAAQGVT